MRLLISLSVSALLHGTAFLFLTEMKPPAHTSDKKIYTIHLRTVEEKPIINPGRPKSVQELPQRSPKTVKKSPPPTPHPKSIETPSSERLPRSKSVIRSKGNESFPKRNPAPPTKERMETPSPERLSQGKNVIRSKGNENERLHVPPPKQDFTPPKRERKDTEGEYKKKNLSFIREVISSYLTYPPVARRMGWEGKVVVVFKLTPEGYVEDLRIKRSSGYELLDKNTLRLIKEASREFPKPEKTITLIVPVVYKLE